MIRIKTYHRGDEVNRAKTPEKITQFSVQQYEWGSFHFAACCGSMFTDDEDIFNITNRGVDVGWFPVDHQLAKVDAVIPVGDAGMALHIRVAGKTIGRFTDKGAFQSEVVLYPKKESYEVRYTYPDLVAKLEKYAGGQVFCPDVASLYLEGVATARLDWEGRMASCSDALKNLKEEVLLTIHTPFQMAQFNEVSKLLPRPVIWQSDHFAFNVNTNSPDRLKLTVFGANHAK